MTPVEIRDALKVFTDECGRHGYASVNVTVSDDYTNEVVGATLYPDGVGGTKHAIRATGEDFAEALSNLRLKWDAAKDLLDKNTVRKMALAIIEITGDQGECSDAALRGAGFYQHQIRRMGATACAEATRLAAGGPFSIVTMAGANAEAA